jgi:hypothetical protein
VIPHGVACGLHYLFSLVDADRADTFVDQVAGDAKPAHSGVQALVRQLSEERNHGGEISQQYVSALAIKAWEAFRQDREVGFLRYSASDKFPDVTGLPAQLGLDGVVRADRHIRDVNDEELDRIVVSVEHISPERAAEILSHNDGNRRIAAAVVDKYARDIAAGSWALNGQTIKLGRGADSLTVSIGAPPR